MSNQPSSSQPIPWGAIIGIAVLVIIGGTMLGYSIVTLLNNAGEQAGQPTATVPATAVVLIPTVTAGNQPAPTDVPAPTDPAPTQPAPAITDTSGPPTPLPTDTIPPGNLVSVFLPANVRAGPGVLYAVIGGLNAGATAEAVGRDSSGTWFVIALPSGQGWISNQVASYSGDVNSLPVIAAPPLPATATRTRTATPVLPSATPTVAYPAGFRVNYFRLTGNITQVNRNTPFQFQFSVTNMTGSPIAFGGMGGMALPGGPAQASWATMGNPIQPGQTLAWEDNLTIPNPGTYQIHLGVCFLQDQPTCSGNPGAWQVLSGGITLVVN